MTTEEWRSSTIPGIEAWQRRREWHGQWLRRRGYNPDSTSAMWKSVATATNAEHVDVLLDFLRTKSFTSSQASTLRRLCTFPSLEVQNSAMTMLVRSYPRRMGVTLLRELLVEPKCRIKYFLYSKLAEIGYRQDVSLVAEYVRTLLTRRTKRGVSGGVWDGCKFCSFLDEFIRVDSRVMSFYEWLDSRHDLLEPFDLQSLRRRQPYFGHHSGRRWVLAVTDSTLGGRRLIGDLGRTPLGLGISSLQTTNPRFNSALRVFGEEADLVLVVGATLANRIRRLATDQMAPIHAIEAHEYGRLIDHERGGWATVAEGEFRRIADEEDARILKQLIPVIEEARVRHTRPLKERLG